MENLDADQVKQEPDGDHLDARTLTVGTLLRSKGKIWLLPPDAFDPELIKSKEYISIAECSVKAQKFMVVIDHAKSTLDKWLYCKVLVPSEERIGYFCVDDMPLVEIVT